jgi:hypothetical protein
MAADGLYKRFVWRETARYWEAEAALLLNQVYASMLYFKSFYERWSGRSYEWRCHRAAGADVAYKWQLAITRNELAGRSLLTDTRRELIEYAGKHGIRLS